ncbi:hypothetical protein QQF64_002761 [Cirrhinus molitorella]|uniref:CCHC-type domain-containing protein n=1 Tax=Cirrhinus molitorella TaxID=172907 RepID=A0ABR3MR28_9TELE
MDPAEETNLHAALELQGVMLGRHEHELSAARRSLESITAQLGDLVERLNQLSLLRTASQPAATSTPAHEPRVNNPPPYAGEATSCRSFLTQCEVVFSLQPRTYSTETAKVAFVISLLTGRARDWGAATWESQTLCCFEYRLFRQEMLKVFDHSVFGKEASRLLASLQQGRRSVADYSVEFRTLAATSEWNPEALSARFLEGLRESLKDELYAREVPESLDELIALAIRLDARRELRRRVRGTSELDSPIPSAPRAPTEEPMQIGRLRLSARERQRRRLEGLCMYCAAAGHQAHDCPISPSNRSSKVKTTVGGITVPTSKNSRTVFSVLISVNNMSFKTSALIDSGAEGDFADEEWVRAHKIPCMSLDHPIAVQGLEGRTLMQITHKTVPVEDADLSRVPTEYHDLRAVFSRSRAVSLPPSRPRVVGALTWGIESRVKRAQAGIEVPEGCPTGLLFVPQSVRAAVLQWGHSSRLACHPVRFVFAVSFQLSRLDPLLLPS